MPRWIFLTPNSYFLIILAERIRRGSAKVTVTFSWGGIKSDCHRFTLVFHCGGYLKNKNNGIELYL